MPESLPNDLARHIPDQFQLSCLICFSSNSPQCLAAVSFCIRCTLYLLPFPVFVTAGDLIIRLTVFRANLFCICRAIELIILLIINQFRPRERNRTAHIARRFRSRPRPPGLYNLRKSAYVPAGTHILPFPGSCRSFPAVKLT